MFARLLFTLSILAWSVSAPQAELCSKSQNSTLLTLKSWEAVLRKDAFDEQIILTAVIHSNASKDIRMVDGSIRFRDALGQEIAGLGLDRDLYIVKEQDTVQNGAWMPMTIGRLLKVNKSDIEAGICVKAVIYADGEKVEFK